MSVSNPSRGDLVSFDTAQVLRVSVTTLPAPGNVTYMLSLGGIDFTVTVAEGAIAADVVAALAAALDAQQTRWGAAVDDDDSSLVLTGPLQPVVGASGVMQPMDGDTDWTVTANLTLTVLQMLSIDATRSGAWRVLRTQRFYSRDTTGALQTIDKMWMRRLGAGDLLEQYASEVPTLLARAEVVP